MNPRISVSEGHQLGEGVSRNLLARFSDVGDVVVHIDPQSSEEAAHSPNHKQQLPDRSEVISNIKRHWQNLLPEDNIERLDLHYLEQGIEIDLVVTLDEISNTLASQLEQAIQGVEHISKLRIYRKLSESKNAQQLS